MTRRYTFKMYPRPAQAKALHGALRLHSRLRNAIVRQRLDAEQGIVRSLLECIAPPVVPDGETRAQRDERRRQEAQRRRDNRAWAREFRCAHRLPTSQQKGGYQGIRELREAMPEYRAIPSAALAITSERVDQAFKFAGQVAWSYALIRAGKPYPGPTKIPANAWARGKEIHRSGSPVDKYGELKWTPGFRRTEGFGFKKHGAGWRLDLRPADTRGRARPAHGRLYLKGIPGLIRVRGRLPAVPAAIKTCDIKFHAGDWWLSVVVEMPPRLSAGKDKGEVEFQLVDHFATVRRENGGCPAGPENAETQVFAFVDGRITLVSEAVTPKLLSPPGKPGGDDRQGFAGVRCRDAARETGSDDRRQAVAALQRAMARCKRGSNRYRKLRLRKARIEARTARRRREALHLWTTGLARRFGELSILKPASIKDATASGRGTARDPGAAVDLKAALNRHDLSQAPAVAIKMLEYKLAEAGGHATVIAMSNPRRSISATRSLQRPRRNANSRGPSAMHPDLLDAIATAKQARDGVLNKSMSVKEANAVAANNHTIVTAHGLALRERIFVAETALPSLASKAAA